MQLKGIEEGLDIELYVMWLESEHNVYKNNNKS